MAYLPTTSYLSAFERSFESFLQATPAPSPYPSAGPYVPSPSYDQNNPNSQESISAILSTVNVTPGSASPILLGTPQHLRRTTAYPSSQTTPRNEGAKPRISRRTEGSPLVFNSPSQAQYGGQAAYVPSQTTPRILKKVQGSPLSLSHSQFQGQYGGRQDLDPMSLRTVTATPEAAPVPARKHPFTCSYCLRGFRKETTLSLHQCIMRTPSSECGFCGKRFVSIQSLGQHRCGAAASEDHSQTKKMRRSSTAPAPVVKASRVSGVSGDRAEMVEIEVPVSLVNTEIIFQEPSGIAIIVGDIIELHPQYETLEDAVVDGTQIETLPAQVRYVLADDIREESPRKSLPEARDQMASDAGLSLQDLNDIFSLFAGDSEERGQSDKLPRQQKETPVKKPEVTGESLIQSATKGEMSSTLDESFSGRKTPANDSSARKMIARSVSLQKFTYFNDTPLTIVGSADDSDDDDWLATNIKCKPCRKVFTSKSQYRKHLKTHSKGKKVLRKDVIASVKVPQKVLTLDED